MFLLPIRPAAVFPAIINGVGSIGFSKLVLYIVLSAPSESATLEASFSLFCSCGAC
jgi:hypothetical protein